MSFVQAGHFITFFCTLNVRLPSHVLCLTKLWPAKKSSRHALQKLCAQGVVRGLVITCRQIWQLNSASWMKQKQTFIPESISGSLIIVREHATAATWAKMKKNEVVNIDLIKDCTFQKLLSHKHILSLPPNFLHFCTIILISTIDLFSTVWLRFLPHPTTFVLLRNINNIFQNKYLISWGTEITSFKINIWLSGSF